MLDELIIVPLGTVSPYCSNDKNCSGFLIKYNNKNYLLDCGNGITRNMKMNEDLKNLKVFISHLHVDHYGDVLCLAQSALVYNRLGLIDEKLDIYIPGDDYLNSKKKHIEDYYFLHSLEKEYPINIIDYEYLHVDDDNLKVSSIYVPHQVKAHAFRIDTEIGSVVYSGDTGSKNNLREFAKNCDLFICESTFLKDEMRRCDSHLFTTDAALIAKVKKLMLTHFWPETDKNKYVDEAKEIFENTIFAEEGKKYILKK